MNYATLKSVKNTLQNVKNTGHCGAPVNREDHIITKYESVDHVCN